MYETGHETVPLQGEMEFMRNYVELMKLRHNDKLKVTTKWPDTPPSTLHLPPLLFISLIENAFKHGVSSNRTSRIDIALRADAEHICFTCANTYYPKDGQNRSGSGIGLENTHRRIDLMYPGHYTWEQTLAEDKIFRIRITISEPNKT
jgi:sensor histidine kinase YesM